MCTKTWSTENGEWALRVPTLEQYQENNGVILSTICCLCSKTNKCLFFYPGMYVLLLVLEVCSCQYSNFFKEDDRFATWALLKPHCKYTRKDTSYWSVLEQHNESLPALGLLVFSWSLASELKNKKDFTVKMYLSLHYITLHCITSHYHYE